VVYFGTVVSICSVVDQATIITGGRAISKVRLMDEEDEVIKAYEYPP